MSNTSHIRNGMDLVAPEGQAVPHITDQIPVKVVNGVTGA
jgi:hypothetical protein